jgi:hypothetical protein
MAPLCCTNCLRLQQHRPAPKSWGGGPHVKRSWTPSFLLLWSRLVFLRQRPNSTLPVDVSTTFPLGAVPIGSWTYRITQLLVDKDRLSSTTYRITQLDNLRVCERFISSLLPWRATTARVVRNAQYDASTSTPFVVVGEFLAVRGDPKSWFYIAKITYVGASPYHHC